MSRRCCSAANRCATPTSRRGSPTCRAARAHVGGGHAALALHPALSLGAGYLRSERQVPGTPPELAEYASTDLTLRAARLLPSLASRGLDLQAYAEYAGQSWDPLHDGLDTGRAAPHAFYTATQLSYGRWGGSFETKDYDGFALGWNDPPNLVPEMSQHLLNRMSHFLLAGGEHGRQISVMGSLPGERTLQFESARAANEVNGLRHYRLDALVLQGDPLASPALGGLRRHGSRRGRRHHRSPDGGNRRGPGDRRGPEPPPERGIPARRADDVRRRVDLREHLPELSALGRAGRGTLALQVEFSNDPDEKDDPLTFDVVEIEPRRWLGLVAVGAPESPPRSRAVRRQPARRHRLHVGHLLPGAGFHGRGTAADQPFLTPGAPLYFRSPGLWNAGRRDRFRGVPAAPPRSRFRQRLRPGSRKWSRRRSRLAKG